MIDAIKTKKRAKRIQAGRIESPIDFDQYITLEQAQDISGYPAAFLNAIIDDYALRAITIGETRLTKKEWIDDYTRRADESKREVSKIRESMEAVASRPVFAGITAAPAKRNRRAVESGSRSGDLYLWFACFLFVLFFASTFGQGSLMSVWLDVKSAAAGARLDFGYEQKGASRFGQNMSRANTSSLSSTLAELYGVPAMPDESFRPFFSSTLNRVSDVLFVSEIGSYAEWIKASLKHRVEDF